MTTEPLTLYHDGRCPLCALEVAHYRRVALPGALMFVDIAEASFDAAAHGLDPQRIHRVMHARRGDTLYLGVDVFIELWASVPRYRRFAPLARLPGVYHVLALGYRLFARLRPYLSRRRRGGCDAGTCAR